MVNLFSHFPKVRAMFDERRHRITAGIDKSYLLEPIIVDPKMTTTTKRVIAPSKPAKYDQKMTTYSKVIVPPLQSRVLNRNGNGANRVSVRGDPLQETFPENLDSGSQLGAKKVVTRKLTPAVGMMEEKVRFSLANRSQLFTISLEISNQKLKQVAES